MEDKKISVNQKETTELPENPHRHTASYKQNGHIAFTALSAVLTISQTIVIYSQQFHIFVLMLIILVLQVSLLAISIILKTHRVSFPSGLRIHGILITLAYSLSLASCLLLMIACLLLDEDKRVSIRSFYMFIAMGDIVASFCLVIPLVAQSVFLIVEGVVFVLVQEQMKSSWMIVLLDLMLFIVLKAGAFFLNAVNRRLHEGIDRAIGGSDSGFSVVDSIPCGILSLNLSNGTGHGNKSFGRFIDMMDPIEMKKYETDFISEPPFEADREGLNFCLDIKSRQGFSKTPISINKHRKNLQSILRNKTSHAKEKQVVICENDVASEDVKRNPNRIETEEWLKCNRSEIITNRLEITDVRLIRDFEVEPATRLTNKESPNLHKRDSSKSRLNVGVSRPATVKRASMVNLTEFFQSIEVEYTMDPQLFKRIGEFRQKKLSSYLVLRKGTNMSQERQAEMQDDRISILDIVVYCNSSEFACCEEFQVVGLFKIPKLALICKEKDLMYKLAIRKSDEGGFRLDLFFSDVTEILENQVLLAQHQVKSILLAKIGHEFKTPLITINQIMSEQVQVYSEEMYSALQHSKADLSRLGFDILDLKRSFLSITNLSLSIYYLIQDLMVYSNYHFGQEVRRVEEEIQVTEYFESLYSMCRTLLEMEMKLDKITLDFVIDEAQFAQEKFVSDPDILSQILINLIKNSIRFTKRGYIKLKIQKTQYGIKFSLSDTGGGMNSLMLKKAMTTREFKLNIVNESRINRNNSGLGLIICNFLIGMIGRDFDLRNSDLGLDVTFEARNFPLSAREPNPSEHARTKNSKMTLESQGNLGVIQGDFSCSDLESENPVERSKETVRNTPNFLEFEEKAQVRETFDRSIVDTSNRKLREETKNMENTVRKSFSSNSSESDLDIQKASNRVDLNNGKPHDLDSLVDRQLFFSSNKAPREMDNPLIEILNRPRLPSYKSNTQTFRFNPDSFKDFDCTPQNSFKINPEAALQSGSCVRNDSSGKMRRSFQCNHTHTSESRPRRTKFILPKKRVSTLSQITKSCKEMRDSKEEIKLLRQEGSKALNHFKILSKAQNEEMPEDNEVFGSLYERKFSSLYYGPQLNHRNSSNREKEVSPYTVGQSAHEQSAPRNVPRSNQSNPNFHPTVSLPEPRESLSESRQSGQSMFLISKEPVMLSVERNYRRKSSMYTTEKKIESAVSLTIVPSINKQKESHSGESKFDELKKYSTYDVKNIIEKVAELTEVKKVPKIIVCDDYPMVRKSTKKVILEVLNASSCNNYEIITVKDGIELLYLMTIDEEQGNFVKMIFCDENMGYMNGSEAFTLLNRMVSENKLKNSFFFVTATAYSDADTINYLHDIGIEEILTKPVNRRKVEFVLKKYQLV